MAATIKIPTVFTAKDKFSDVLKTMSSNVSKFNSKLAGMERVNSKLNSLKYHALAGGAAIGVAVKSANDFQSSMGNVATLIDTSVEDIDKMGKEVLDLSKKIPVPIDQLTKSLYDIRSAGIPASQAMEALGTAGKLSVAGIATTEQATNLLTSAMNAFQSEGLKSDEIANILFKTVKAGKTDIAQLSQAFGSTAPIIQSAGVQLADFSAATAALTTVGTPASQAQNQIRASIVAMQKPTADMAKIFKQLGVSSEKELIQKKGGLVGAMQAINKAGSDMGINLAKAWSSTEAGAAVTSLTGQTNKAYLKTVQDMAGGVDELAKAYAKKSKEEKQQLKLAKNNMQALSITIGTQLAPMITQAVDAIVPLIDRFTDFISQNKWIIKSIPYLIGGIVAFKVALLGMRAAVVANNIVMGISAARAGAMSLAMKGNKIALISYSIASKVATGAQWLLNAAMSANPIGLVIAAIVALIGVVYTIIKYYDKWGASLALILGPFGMIINLIMSFRRHWDSIVKAFKEGGIVAGLKRIGAVILDALLMPIQQFLGLLSKIPGVGDMIKPATEFISNMRANLSLDDDQNTPVLENSQTKATREQMIAFRERRGRIDLNVNDPSGAVKNTESTGDYDIPINMSPTTGVR